MEGWGGSKKPTFTSKTRRRASAGDGSPPCRVLTRWRGGVGRKGHLRVNWGVGWVEKPTFASKNETEGFCWGQKPSISRFDAMEGWGGSKSQLLRRNTTGRASTGHRSPPSRVSTRWRGGGGQNCPIVASKREMEQWEDVAEAEQEKSALYGAFFLFGTCGDVSLGLGMCH